jgi:hypothetical protein
MKLRSVALVGVVCIATLGLIGVGAHAAFTTSTTSGQTITAGTWATQPTKSITRRTITTTDPTAPTASITYPVDGTSYGTAWTGTITGTASSAASTTITAAAMVAIEDTTTNQWWNGTAFAASSQSFVAANGNTTWYLAFGAGNLTAGNSYSVVAEVTDSAENVGTSSTVSFTCGTAAMIDPTVGVTYPVDGTSYGADWTGTILGTASSGASTTITATAMVAIEDTTTNQWWNGSSFNDATQSFVAAIGNTTWYLAFGAGNLTAGNNYSVVAEVTDSASNVGTSSTVSFTYGTAQAPGASNG